MKPEDRPTTDANAGHSTLTAESPVIASSEASTLALTHWGLTVSADRLAGERDDNFRLHAPDGTRYMLKIVHVAEDPQVTDCQTAVLEHLRLGSPTVPVARVLPDSSGQLTPRPTSGPAAGRALRLTDFLPGTLLKNAPSSTELLTSIGGTLASLGQALATFDHPAARSHTQLWDLAQAAQLRDLIEDLDDDRHRQTLRRLLDRFNDRVAPALPQLRQQIIHNDFSGDNVMVDPAYRKVTGVLDFGDMAYTALINDVAVAAAYQLSDDADPLSSALDLVAAYHSVAPLRDNEIDLLFELIVARMLVRLSITEWRAFKFPANREYIVRNNSRTWAQLERLLAIAPDEALIRFREACGTV